jgi:4-aminobutyrate aminotransferase-like enzyme/Ser/Thr protein kinase RdoA (MazF antagonist)
LFAAESLDSDKGGVMTSHWQKVLHDHWNISASLTRLNGEYDLNFMAMTASGEGYVLKVMRPGCDSGLVEMQCAALEQIHTNAAEVPTPEVILTKRGAPFLELSDENGEYRLVWVQERLGGMAYGDFRPHSQHLVTELGHQIGLMDKALTGFNHPYLAREFKWKLPAGAWIKNHLDAIEDVNRRALLSEILAEYRELLPALATLPEVAIHNDMNDYNILVTASIDGRHGVSGIVDFGDMVVSPRVCELAIAGAYVVLDHEKPEVMLAALVAGYHAAYPLEIAEIDMIWPLLRMRLAVSVVNSTLETMENPDDPYITISQAPAWRFLDRNDSTTGAIRARLRIAGDFPVTNGSQVVLDYLDRNRGSFYALLDQELKDLPRTALSVADSTIPLNPFNMTETEALQVGRPCGDAGGLRLGYWGEPRLIYSTDAFRNGPWKASDRRTVHLGIDIFAPAGTMLYAPVDGVVEVVENRTGYLDYGGMVILRHETPEGVNFFTLYGHLDAEFLTGLKPGAPIAAGESFARLGDSDKNGGWSPHVHVQIALTLDGMGYDWPGVVDPDEMTFWSSICPNPAALLNLVDDRVAYQVLDRESILSDRRRHFGRNLKLSYAEPLMFLRGWRHHLFDEWGRAYLDAYNNVPHVGHAHPRIQAVAADQLKRMNSNTRYLHPVQTAFAQKILSKLPDRLSVCFLVNSGTEANELALRLARAHTGGKDMVTPDHGYHGNTTGAIDISAYKFNKPGGVGQSGWVHLVEVADDYRGRFRRDNPDRAIKYAAQVDDALSAIEARGGRLAGWICETFPSVGGQIIPPQGYLAAVYDKIRAAGGICIADEVQTGLGRLGDYYFGFEQQEVVPDIVVLGKPIGNGHPLGVLVTTAVIAESFAQGPEYFSTFGGSTLSCRIGREVLEIVDDEGLQENARVMGKRLLNGLKSLQQQHMVVGDVRGIGLFIGVELVNSRQTLAPATEIANYVLNRMRDERILVGTEGPADNILKIRPPLTIEQNDIDMILAVMDRVLAEAEILNIVNL